MSIFHINSSFSTTAIIIYLKWINLQILNFLFFSISMIIAIILIISSIIWWFFFFKLFLIIIKYVFLICSESMSVMLASIKWSSTIYSWSTSYCTIFLIINLFFKIRHLFNLCFPFPFPFIMFIIWIVINILKPLIFQTLSCVTCSTHCRFGTESLIASGVFKEIWFMFLFEISLILLFTTIFVSHIF